MSLFRLLISVCPCLRPPDGQQPPTRDGRAAVWPATRQQGLKAGGLILPAVARGVLPGMARSPIDTNRVVINELVNNA